METPIASIAQEPALPLQGELLMINYEAIIRYKTSMAIFKKCFKKGIIDSADLGLINSILTEKYGIPPNSIFLDNDLQFMRK